MGYPRHLHTVAEELAACSLPLAMVEFANIKGQESLARAAGPNILRLHSIPAEELSTMTPERARERLVRARAERSIPLCICGLCLQERIFWQKIQLSWLGCGRSWKL